MRGLKIYACSGFAGVGAREADFTYWLDNTATVNNTRAVNGLLADINLLFSNLQYKELTEKEIIDSLNAIDLYAVTLQGVKRYTGVPDMLERWGGVVCSMVDEGLFTNSSVDNDERDANLDALIEDAFLRMGSNEGYMLCGSLSEWYRAEILDEDWNGLQSGGIDVFKGVKGVGASGDAGEILSNSGYYFFGTYLTSAQLNRSTVSIRTRVRYEKELYKKAEETYGSLYSKDAFSKVIYCGCQNSLKSSPESVAERVFGKSNGVGVLGIDDILFIVVTILPVVLSFLQSVAENITNYFRAKDTSKITKDDINNSILSNKELEDAYNKRVGGISTAGMSGFLMWGVILGAIYKLVIKRKK